MESTPTGVTIRNPSTANLFIDSIDRTSGYSGNFVINLKNSILNGFFHRLGIAEVILDWCVDNISAATFNNTLTISVGGATHTVTLPDGSYTVQQCLDALVVALNAAGTGLTFSITQGPGYKELSATAGFRILEGNLQTELNLFVDADGTAFAVRCPKLLPYTYVDFVSPELTYNQALKDAGTNSHIRDSLYRWNFAWDNIPAPLDSYGYPIYQGYQSFICRRVLPFPKQIRWMNNMPVGQISFQLYTSQGDLLTTGQASGGEVEWNMTLLVSEN